MLLSIRSLACGAILLLGLSAEAAGRSTKGTEAKPPGAEDKDADIQALLDWAVSQGAVLKVKVGLNDKGIRGIIATEDIEPNSPTMMIPRHMALSIPNKDLIAVDMAPFLLKELRSNCSNYQPYLDILPEPHEVVTGYNFPEQYLKYLNSPDMIHMVKIFMENSQGMLEGARDQGLPLTLWEAMGSNETITHDYLKYVTALIASRTIQFRNAALSMVPIADLVNHRGGPPGDCYFTQLDSFLCVSCYTAKKAGDEVTITYGDMRMDVSFLYYGFVETSENPRLASIDHPEYNPEVLDQKFTQEIFTGTLENMEAERARLEIRLKSIDAGHAALGPIPSIPGLESFKSAIELLNKERRKAIVNEIVRLTSVIEATRNEL